MATTDQCIDTLLYRRAQAQGVRYGLAPIQSVLDKLGHPHLKTAAGIHIAGTNGNGSTAHYLESLLISAGCRVAVFSSPHLFSYTERFRVQKQAIDDPLLQDTILKLIANPITEPLTEFELLMVAACLIFSDIPLFFLPFFGYG